MDLEKRIKILETIANELTVQNGYEVTFEDIEMALCIRLTDILKLEWNGDLLNHELTREEIIKAISGFDFRVLKDPIETDLDLIPEELRKNEKVRVKFKGSVWFIHLYDADPFPSNPHAHEYNSGVKLDLSNGKCYRHKQYENSFNRKTLIEFRNLASLKYKGSLPKLTI